MSVAATAISFWDSDFLSELKTFLGHEIPGVCSDARMVYYPASYRLDLPFADSLGAMRSPN